MDLATGLGFLGKGMHQIPDMAMRWGTGGKVAMIIFAVAWIFMLINCLQRKFKDGTDKIAWVLVLVFVPIIGVLAYIFSIYFEAKK